MEHTEERRRSSRAGDQRPATNPASSGCPIMPLNMLNAPTGTHVRSRHIGYIRDRRSALDSARKVPTPPTPDVGAGPEANPLPADLQPAMRQTSPRTVEYVRAGAAAAPPIDPIVIGVRRPSHEEGDRPAVTPGDSCRDLRELTGSPEPAGAHGAVPRDRQYSHGASASCIPKPPLPARPRPRRNPASPDPEGRPPQKTRGCNR